MKKFQREHPDTRRVILPGRVSRELIPDYFRAADVFVLPSLSEGSGNVLLEAAACGCPAIGSNVGGIPDYIEGDDCYDAIGFHGPYKITGNVSTPIVGNGHINVQAYHSLFLHSSFGLQGDCIGPDDSQSIIRRVVLDSAPGCMVNDFRSLPYDYVSVQASQVRNISFRLADYRGRTVDLQHQGFSFSLLFVPEDEF